MQQKGAYPSAMAIWEGRLVSRLRTMNTVKPLQLLATAAWPDPFRHQDVLPLFNDVNVSTFVQVIRWQPSERTRACGCITHKEAARLR
jgi:hypothetical protein